jgi:TolB-like protein/class 3 adenylate cyclase/Tfp pilus assembly protein PilF
MSETRKIAAILVADIVGYSRLAGADEDRILARLRALRSDLIDPTIALHHGRIVKRTGDGSLIEFRSVVDAVRCAIEVQNGMVERNAGLPPERRIEFRVGIHLGDVVEEADGDLMGDGVNIAARLEGIANPGAICLSEDAYRQVSGRLDMAVADLGPTQLKNIERPIRVYSLQVGKPAQAKAASDTKPSDKPTGSQSRSLMVGGRFLPAAAAGLVLLLAAGGWLFWPRHPAPGLVSKSSVAVLPFANLAGDEATGRLADGLTEDIITDLSRYRTMDVIARNSTERYKGKAADVRQVGKDLNARFVLEGSVQREGDQIRVTAQLIDGTSDAHLWSERWDRPSKEFFAVQSEIADQLGTRLGGSGVIDKAEQEAAKRSRPENFTAYELYLAGHSEHLRMNQDGNKNAIELLEKAVAADPRLARAWAELSTARQASTNYGADPTLANSAALAAARRAVEIDPRDAMAHAQLAFALAMKGDFAPSEAEFDTALRLNPGDAEVLAMYAAWPSSFGHPEHGAEAADHAIRLNPNYQVWQAWNFSWAYFAVGRFEDTLRILERLPKDNYLVYSWVQRAASYAALGRSAEAKAATSDALQHFPDLTIEGVTGTADNSDADRIRLIGPMRAAGFPACAKPETLAKNPQLVRLPECLSK